MKYQDIHPKTILNKYKEVDSWFRCRYSLNIYRGCEHGCKYCYGRAEKYWPDGGNISYSDIIQIKKEAPQLLDKELFRIKKKEVICLGGGVNDSYQQCENEFKLTRKCLEVLKLHRFPIHLMTKSSLILRDTDILKEIAKDNWLYVTFSFSTPDERLAKLLEPNASRPSERLKAMKKLSGLGIRCGVNYMPVLPYITDPEEMIERMFKLAKENSAEYLLDSPLTLTGYQKEFFFSFMQDSKLKRYLKRYERLYRDGDAPKTSYFRKINRIFFDLSSKYSIARTMPAFEPEAADTQTRL